MIYAFGNLVYFKSKPYSFYIIYTYTVVVLTLARCEIVCGRIFND